jgi:hypothetical protein
MTSINVRTKSLAKPIIIDGIARTGKFFLGKLLCGLENIEYFQYVSALEQIPYLNKLGAINEDAAISLLQIIIDEHAYNMSIGRNINLRYDDGSSVNNSLEAELYINRAQMPIDLNSFIDKSSMISNRLSPFITHETFPNIKIFLKAFQDLKIVLLKRHPIDVMHSWLKRGWGKRYNNEDVLAFIPLLKKNNIVYPWYISGMEKEYFKSTEIERIILSVTLLMDMEAETFKSLSKQQQEQVLIIHYDSLVENTENEIQRMEKYFQAKASTRMPMIMQNENCPIQLQSDKRIQKMNELSQNISQKYIDLILRKVVEYESVYPQTNQI